MNTSQNYLPITEMIENHIAFCNATYFSSSPKNLQPHEYKKEVLELLRPHIRVLEESQQEKAKEEEREKIIDLIYKQIAKFKSMGNYGPDLYVHNSEIDCLSEIVDIISDNQ